MLLLLTLPPPLLILPSFGIMVDDSGVMTLVDNREKAMEASDMVACNQSQSQSVAKMSGVYVVWEMRRMRARFSFLPVSTAATKIQCSVYLLRELGVIYLDST